MTVLLRTSEVADLLDLPRAIDVLERVYREQAAGEIDAVPPLRLMDRGLRMVVGRLRAERRMGVRLSATEGHTAALLFDVDTGELLTMMGYPFSHLRISATVGLALKHLANPRATTAALIGSGRLAPSLLVAATGVLPLRRVRVYSPTPAHRESFAARSTEQLKVQVEPASTPQEALGDTDLVLVTTNARGAVLRGAWLKAGQTVFGAGRPNELDDDVYLGASTIVVSSKTHEQGYYDVELDKPLLRLAASGDVDWNGVLELGEVVAHTRPVAPRGDGWVVFRESQGGYSDVALAASAYEQAIALGRGTEVSLD